MKILHLNRFFYSGQTTHVFSLVKEQQKQGHLAHLALEGYPSLQALDIYKKTLENLNATVLRPGDETTLARLIKQHKFDLLHAHSSLTFNLTLKLSRQFNLPYVITCHGLGLNRKDIKPYLKEASALFCISQRVANSLHEFADNIHVIPNGVDLNEFKPAAKNSPVKIVLATRIDSGKQEGIFQLCKAVDLLEGIIFFVAANKRPPSATAKYLGWQDNIAQLLSKTDIVIGTGRTIIEGLAAGNAALILGRTYQGVLTPEKAAEQKFLDFSGLSGNEPCYKDIFFDLTKMVQEPDYITNLQEFGRKLAGGNFDNKVLCKQIVCVYEKVV